MCVSYGGNDHKLNLTNPFLKHFCPDVLVGHKYQYWYFDSLSSVCILRWLFSNTPHWHYDESIELTNLLSPHEALKFQGIK